MSAIDVIDQFAGITPGSIIDQIRNDRVVARENAQKSYVALFDPDDETQASVPERLAIAWFVAKLHDDEPIAEHYLALLRAERHTRNLESALARVLETAETKGPYGHYPKGPLTAENEDGLHWRIGEAERDALGERLAAALEHTHLLVFHPRDASRASLQALIDVGWSATGIVTLSQVVAFLAFQIRVTAGLRVLNTVIAARRRQAAE